MNILRQSSSIDFWQRLFFGGALLIVTALIIGLSHRLEGSGCTIFVASLAGVQQIALTEYISLCRLKGFSPAANSLRLFSWMYQIVYSLYVLYPELENMVTFLLLLGALGMPLLFLRHYQGKLAGIALTMFGFIGITVPLSFLVAINFLPRLPSNTPTTFWLTWLLVTTKGSDIAAYMFGKLLGRHALAPSLSPKKTIEGAICGIIGAILFGIAVPHYWLSPAPDLPRWTWGVLGMIIGIGAILGDLSESLLKRDAGVKDSNNIPGLGGVLDVIDSLLFTSPILYVYLKITDYLGAML